MNKTFFNPAAGEACPGARLYSRENTAELRALFAHSPLFAPTPLHRLDRLAALLGIGEVWAKDERNRWGMGSFKSLGGTHAVVELAAQSLARRAGGCVSAADIFAGRAPKARDMTFATATAGNHGRAVAFGAHLAGARAVVFVYGDVPKKQTKAIAALGAEIVTIAGDYEAACSAAREACRRHGWIMVSDVAEDGYTEIPEKIMRGYSVLAAEALEQAPDPPTHLFLQAGVGGLAAPVAAYFANSISPKPRVAVVEAATVPCLMESARNNRPTRTASSGPTNLNRLDCPTPSSITWPVLRALADCFVGVDNDTAAQAALLLGEQGLPTSPTGAAGLAGLLALSRTKSGFEQFDLGPAGSILLVITEQAVG